jgi:hypothetical protein
MSRKSQKNIGLNVDIPTTTEFEEFAFLNRWQVAADVVKQSVGFPEAARRLNYIILTDSQGG